MKNNRRNRKLQFIRTKNSLRLGLISFFVTGKISKYITEDNTDYIIKNAKEQLYKNYKLVLNNVGIRLGTVNDDFVNGFITYKIELKKYKIRK